MIGTAADETFYGGDLRRDAVVVRARGGDDQVSGTPGDDELYGGAGRDKVRLRQQGTTSCVGSRSCGARPCGAPP